MVALTWNHVKGSQEMEPKLLEITTNTVYLRKNVTRITEEPKNDEDSSVELWQYEECQLTIAEYEEYMANMQNPSTVQIMQQMSEMQSNMEMQGVMTDANTETIMQAISDLSADIAMMNL